MRALIPFMGDDVVRQNGLKILLAAIVTVAAMPIVAGTPTGGPGVQQGPGLGTRLIENPDLTFVGWPGPNVLINCLNGDCLSVCRSAQQTPHTISIDARNRLRITGKGELVYRFRFEIINRGVKPANSFMSRLRTTNLGSNNTASVRSVAKLNPGEKSTQTFEIPLLLMSRNNVDLEFTINHNNRVRERTKGNNTCRMKLEFINNKYDFAIQSFRFNRMAPTCVPGQPVYYFDVTVKNQGNGWLFYGPAVNSMPLIVQDLHAPYYGNPYPGWGGAAPLLSPDNDITRSFKPGEVKRFQIGVGYHRNDPAHMRRGPSHPFQAFVRGSGVKSATLSIQRPTACRGGQPAQLKGLPARSKNKESTPRTVEPIPAKPLPRR